MKTISFISSKGGSGKTILTATIANFLGKLGKNILIVDSDGSTNGMTLFYLKEIKENNSNNNCHGILEEKFNVEECSFTPISEGVSLLPATYQFTNTDSFDVSKFQQNLSGLISLLKNDSKQEFDYVLIDCQAGVDIHSEIVVKENISDEIIIVSEFDPISAAGIERMKGLFHKESIYNRSWVLLNKVLPELSKTSNDFLEITRYLPPVIWTAEVVKKYARKELALDFEVGNEYTLNIVKILRVLFGKEIKASLDKWLESREEIIKKPIYNEYIKIQSDYEELQKSEKAGLFSTLVPLIASITGIVTSIVSVFTFNKSGITEQIFGLDNVWFIGIVAFMVGIFSISAVRYYSRRKEQLSKNEFRKEMLRDRLKELELLKHSDIEKILRSNRNNFA
jgi:cellulose biosynthesis protein BcsQ